jgi:hypothetical protein
MTTTTTTTNLNKLDDMFLEFIRERYTRLQNHLQEILDQNQVPFDLSTLDVAKPLDGQNALREMGIELIQETHNLKYPPVEIWKIMRGQNVIGRFEVDQYGIINDL